MYNRAQTHDPGLEYLSLLYNHTSCIRICLERFYLTLFAASVTNPITIFARLFIIIFFSSSFLFHLFCQRKNLSSANARNRQPRLANSSSPLLLLLLRRRCDFIHAFRVPIDALRVMKNSWEISEGQKTNFALAAEEKESRREIACPTRWIYEEA